MEVLRYYSGIHVRCIDLRAGLFVAGLRVLVVCHIYISFTIDPLFIPMSSSHTTIASKTAYDALAVETGEESDEEVLTDSVEASRCLCIASR